MLDGDLRLGMRKILGIGKVGLLASQRGDEALGKNGQAKTARIDNAILLENGQKLRRTLDRSKGLVRRNPRVR